MRLAATLSGDSCRAGRGPDWRAAIAQIPRVHSKGGHKCSGGRGCGDRTSGMGDRACIADLRHA